MSKLNAIYLIMNYKTVTRLIVMHGRETLTPKEENTLMATERKVLTVVLGPVQEESGNWRAYCQMRKTQRKAQSNLNRTHFSGLEICKEQERIGIQREPI